MSDSDGKKSPNSSQKSNKDADARKHSKSWFSRILSAILSPSAPQKTMNRSDDTETPSRSHPQAISPPCTSEPQLSHKSRKIQIPLSTELEPVESQPVIRPADLISPPARSMEYKSARTEFPLKRPGSKQKSGGVLLINEDEKSSKDDVSPQSSHPQLLSAENEVGKQVERNLSTKQQPIENTQKNVLDGESKSETMIVVNSDEDSADEKVASSKEGVLLDLRSVKLREVFEAEVVDNVSTESASKPKCLYSRITFSRTQTVYALPNTKQRIHKKIIRSRHDAWRRYGALKTIHELGGWTYTMRDKNKYFQKVVKGTPMPPAPMQPPILTEEEFYKRPIVTVVNNKDTRSRRVRNKKKQGDSDTSVSERDPHSC